MPRVSTILHPNSDPAGIAKLVETPEWKAIYNKRTAIERLNRRLKAPSKLKCKG